MSTIRLLPEGKDVPCDHNETVLHALERAGLPLPNDCRAGHCGTCKARITGGDVDRGLYMPVALSEEEVAKGYLLACIATPNSDVIELHYGEAAQAANLPVQLFPPRHGVKFKVVDKLERTSDIVEVRLRPTSDRLRYWPGQYVEVGPPGSDGGRPYSIANAPRGDGELSLYIARAPGGRVSTWLHDEVAIGQNLSVSGPYGTFTGDPKITGPVLCIAAGSALAPILALADAALRRGFRDPVTLLFSARRPEDLYATGLVSYWQYRYSNFRFIRTITRPDGSDAPPTGRVPEILGRVVGHLYHSHVFIAGNADFVAACREAALDQGALEANIHVERFFPAGEPGRSE